MSCAAARRNCRAVSGCRCRYPKATGLRLDFDWPAGCIAKPLVVLVHGLTG